MSFRPVMHPTWWERKRDRTRRACDRTPRPAGPCLEKGAFRYAAQPQAAAGQYVYAYAQPQAAGAAYAQPAQSAYAAYAQPGATAASAPSHEGVGCTSVVGLLIDALVKAGGLVFHCVSTSVEGLALLRGVSGSPRSHFSILEQKDAKLTC